VDITITFQTSDRAGWRNWLEQQHDNSKEVWLVTSKQSPSLTYVEAVEEALCFGWIDGILKRLDTDQLAQHFTPQEKPLDGAEQRTRTATD
jgi:uncharacterized protein YdeI (YjbR/CyaY-like superfamily)